MVKTIGDRLFNCGVTMILAVAGLICFFPMFYVVSVSLTPYNEYLRQGGIVFIPKSITFSAYAEFFSEPYILDCLLTTVFITIVGTLVNMFITVLMAYPLARSDLVFRKFFITFVLIPLLIGGGMIPTYLVVKQTGLIDKIWAYILPGAVWSYILIIAQTFFAQIDASMRESALIDGASEYMILFRIIMPMSMPILATIGLIYGVSHWNEYFASVLYISSPGRKTIQVVLRNMLDRSAMMYTEGVVPTRTLQMAGVVFASVPIIAVYPFLQRYYTQGIMLGAIKG